MTIREVMQRPFDWLEKIKFFRRFAFFWLLWLTTETYFWAMDYAELVHGTEDGTGTATVIGALLVPLSAVQGWVVKLYLENSYDSNPDPTESERRSI